MDTQTYTGSCHCGRIRFEVTTNLSRASECNCSICRKRGYLHHMVPPERFRLLAGAEDLETYQFGTFTARHLFCKALRCGSILSTESRPDKIHDQRALPGGCGSRYIADRKVRRPKLGAQARCAVHWDMERSVVRLMVAIRRTMGI